MKRWICTACGTQYPERDAPPAACPICEDERQPPNRNEPRWLALEQLVASGRTVRVVEHEPGLTGIGTEPGFGIGQRPIVAETPAGNVLWDCMAFLNNDVERAVRERGDLVGIAISHAHYYTTMVEWADRFDVPIFIHAEDRAWVMRPSPRIIFWDGDTREVVPGATLIRLGGHFPGATVLHWRHAADGKGVLLSGDVITPVARPGWATFLYSYPNRIPLPAADVERLRDRIRPWSYDRLYAAWFGLEIIGGADASVLASADRYLRVLGGKETLSPNLSLLDRSTTR